MKSPILYFAFSVLVVCNGCKKEYTCNCQTTKAYLYKGQTEVQNSVDKDSYVYKVKKKPEAETKCNNEHSVNPAQVEASSSSTVSTITTCSIQ